MAEQGLRKPVTRAPAPSWHCLRGGLAPAQLPLAAPLWRSCTCTQNAQQALCSASLRTCTPIQHQHQRQCLIRGLAPRAQAPRPPVKFAHKAAAHNPSSAALKQLHNQVRQTCNPGQSEALSAQARETKLPGWHRCSTTITASMNPVIAQMKQSHL